MKSKLLITSLDHELYKRLKRCQLEIGNLRHQHIVKKAIEEWCDQVEAQLQTQTKNENQSS